MSKIKLLLLQLFIILLCSSVADGSGPRRLSENLSAAYQSVTRPICGTSMPQSPLFVDLDGVQLHSFDDIDSTDFRIAVPHTTGLSKHTPNPSLVSWSWHSIGPLAAMEMMADSLHVAAVVDMEAGNLDAATQGFKVHLTLTHGSYTAFYVCITVVLVALHPIRDLRTALILTKSTLPSTL